MSENTFCFTKQSTVVIYGCSKNGINFYRNLMSAGYCVEAFVDKKAKEYNYVLIIDDKEVPIYEPEQLMNTDKEILVLIAVRNAVEQNSVAHMLWEMGFQNVIYLPMFRENMRNARGIKDLKAFYREFVDGRISENAVLPKQNTLWETEIFWDHALIEQNDDYVMAWVPISLLHYYSVGQHREMVRVDGIATGKKALGEKYLDKSVFQLKWLNDLFQFFVHGQGDLDNYWEVEEEVSNYVKQQSSNENQLWFADRQKCAEMLMTGISTGNDFLIQSAVPVQWNQKGYFNICDGGHRIAFLNCMNMSMIPARIKVEDYKKWVNIDELEKILFHIKENEITIFETPVPHPWFFGCEVREEKFGNTILKCILEQMMTLNLYENFSVLDANPKEGYYLQHFVRIGAEDVTGIVYDKKQQEFLSQLNRLFYMDGRINLLDMEEEKKNEKKYDIVLILKKLCEMEEQERISYIEWISSKTKKMIIWESGINYELEKQMILKYSGCKKYIFLKRVLSENVVREVGIYLKDIC